MQNFEQAIQQAIAFSKTTEGQQFLKQLQQMDDTTLEQAMEKAASGNLKEARQALSQLMQNPEAVKLLQSLGRE